MSRKTPLTGRSLVIILSTMSDRVPKLTSSDLFLAFQVANDVLFWNLNLSEAVNNCRLVGHLLPSALLVDGLDLHLEALKLAWNKRLLRSPKGYTIENIGEVNSVDMAGVCQAQFVPLDEALCYIIFDLNCWQRDSSFDSICAKLAEWYRKMQLPPRELIHATLRSLIKGRQVYHTGYGYNILTAEKMHVADWLGRLPNEMRSHRQPRRSGSLSDISSLIGREDSLTSEHWRLGIPKSGTVMNPYYQLIQVNPYETHLPGFGEENTLDRKDKRKYDKSFLGRLISRVKPRRKLEDIVAPTPAAPAPLLPVPNIGLPSSTRQQEWLWYSGGLQPPSPPQNHPHHHHKHQQHSHQQKPQQHGLRSGEGKTRSSECKRRSRSRDCHVEEAGEERPTESRRHRRKTGGGNSGGGMRTSRSHQERLSGPCMSPTATYDSGFNSSRTVEEQQQQQQSEEPSKMALLTGRMQTAITTGTGGAAAAAGGGGSLDRLRHRRRRWSLHTETAVVESTAVVHPAASHADTAASGLLLANRKASEEQLATLPEVASNQELSRTASSTQLPT